MRFCESLTFNIMKPLWHHSIEFYGGTEETALFSEETIESLVIDVRKNVYYCICRFVAPSQLDSIVEPLYVRPVR